MPDENVNYEHQSSEWQSGYDDFYAWHDDESGEAGIDQFANAPREADYATCVMRDSSLGSQVVCGRCGINCECYVCTNDRPDYATVRRDYDAGWSHANYENAYTGYRAAAGGLTGS